MLRWHSILSFSAVLFLFLPIAKVDAQQLAVTVAQSPPTAAGATQSSASQFAQSSSGAASPSGEAQNQTNPTPAVRPPDLADVLMAHAPKDTTPRPLEDWNDLTVPAGLTGQTMILDSSVFPDLTKEVVRAEWRLGDPLELWIMKPAGVKNPPVILYLYSFPTSNYRYTHDEFCRFLTQKGFAAVGFVSALTGPRYVARPQKEWFVSELKEAMATTVHDVQIILNYLAQRGDMDMTRVGMFGDGSGASIALMAAAVDPRIKVLDLLDPWGDWPDWLAQSKLVPEDERPNYVKPEFLKNVENVDPVKWFPELKERRVRLQLIDGLKVTPKVVQDRIVAAAPKRVQIVHYDTTKDFLVSAEGKGFDWIKEQLSSLAAQANEAGAKNNSTP